MPTEIDPGRADLVVVTNGIPSQPVTGIVNGPPGPPARGLEKSRVEGPSTPKETKDGNAQQKEDASGGFGSCRRCGRLNNSIEARVVGVDVSTIDNGDVWYVYVHIRTVIAANG